jgi:hypothetical protein
MGRNELRRSRQWRQTQGFAVVPLSWPLPFDWGTLPPAKSVVFAGYNT